MNIPLDFEQLPELWQLKRRLQELAQFKSVPSAANVVLPPVACFMFLRLFVTLGYLAQSTNRPGMLTAAGAQQWQASLGPVFGDDCNPVDLLVECGMLQVMPRPSGVSLNPETQNLWCPLFARLNPELAGDYKPAYMRGNINSRLSAALKNIPGEAMQQALLLPTELFRHVDGRTMSSPEVQGAIILIRTLDRCLAKPSRGKAGFTAGLLASAAAVVGKYEEARLREFYNWLANNYQNPALPGTADEILAQFDTVYQGRGG